MIVKNEENNIKRALEWARGVAFEQIVVDTGSTDRTVEVAENLGAKVYHFEWIKDFSAAKNYAIEQASGNWIAFLDADEYFTPGDTKRVLPILNRIDSDDTMRNKVMAMSNPWVQLGDDGKPIEVHQQERLFRNDPAVRYIGRIHERLDIKKIENIHYNDELNIMHTGYTTEAYLDTKKASRNIELLRIELADNPNDLNLKAYLADAVKAEEDEKSLAEADELYMEVAKSQGGVIDILQKRAYKHFLDKYIMADEIIPEYEELCQKALSEQPNDLDYRCYFAAILNRNGKHQQALDVLLDCEGRLPNANINDSTIISANPQFMFGQMVLASQGIGDVAGVIKYATMILIIDKTKSEILSPYLYTLVKQNVSVEEILSILTGIYNLNDPQDLLLIARAAKDIGAIELARAVMDIAGRIING